MFTREEAVGILSALGCAISEGMGDKILSKQIALKVEELFPGILRDNSSTWLVDKANEVY